MANPNPEAAVAAHKRMAAELRAEAPKVADKIPNKAKLFGTKIANVSVPQGEVGIKKISNIMMALSDFMIANPSATQKEAAAHFGRSVGWVGTMTRSDAFRLMHQTRWEALGESTKDKVERTAHRTLDVINERLADEGKTIPLSDLAKIGDLSLKALGFGAQRGQTAIQVNADAAQIVVEPSAMEEAKERLANLRAINDEDLASRRPLIEQGPTDDEEELSSGLVAYA